MESKAEYQAGLQIRKAQPRDLAQSPIEPIKDYARSLEVKERFIDAVGKSQSGIYIQAALLAVASNPKLMECTPQSIFSETLRAATLQLVVDPSIGHAYLVPYKGKASLVIGYRGLYHMAMRTGEYRYINVSKFYEGEFVTEDKVSGQITPGGEPLPNGKIIGWMASFQLRNGFSKQLYMSVQEIHLHAKKYSPYYSYATSKWQTDPTAMERKTVLRRLISQWGYLDPVDRMALAKTVDEGNIIDGNLEDMPDPDEVTVEDPYYKDFTEEQHLEELGY